MKVRELNSKTLDDALYAAEQIEVWLKGTARMKQGEKPVRRERNLRGTLTNSDNIVDQLIERIDHIDKSL